MAVEITLAPTPKPGRTLEEFSQAVSVWTRQAQQAITKIASNSGSGGTTQIADSTHTGLLSSADWSTFNSKQGALPIADATHSGILSSTDWNSFNSKQPAGAYLLDAPSDGSTYGRKNGTWVSVTGALSFGNLTETTSSVLAIGNGAGAVIGSGTTITVKQASAGQSGFLSSADWTTFNGKQNLLVAADATHNGYLTSADWNTFNGKQSSLPNADSTHSGILTSTDWNTFNGKQANLGFTPENVANKDVTTTLGTSDISYPSQKAVKTYVDNSVAAASVKSVVLCAGFTPLLAGADLGEVVIPLSPAGTSIAFNIKRLVFRVGLAGGAPSVTIEKSTVSGAFSATTVGTVTLASGAYEGIVTSALGTINSGEKLRFNATTLASAQNWTVIVEIAPP